MKTTMTFQPNRFGGYHRPAFGQQRTISKYPNYEVIANIRRVEKGPVAGLLDRLFFSGNRKTDSTLAGLNLLV